MAKPVKYQPTLSASDVVDGMNAALRNARRLAADAKLLLIADRWPTAVSLAILSLEEAGKVVVLRYLSIAFDPAASKARWGDYRSHQAKLKHPIGINPEGKSLADPATWAGVGRANAELVASLDRLKQAGFYTDCVPSDGRQPIWTEPACHFTEKQAREAVECAIMASSKPDVSLRDIELLVEHVGPVYGTIGIMDGWRAWLAAMEVEGLLHTTREDLEDQMLDSLVGKNWRDGSESWRS